MHVLLKSARCEQGLIEAELWYHIFVLFLQPVRGTFNEGSDSSVMLDQVGVKNGKP